MANDRQSVDPSAWFDPVFTDTALDALKDTFFVFDPKTGKALRWNRSFRERSGYSDAEIAELRAPESYFSGANLTRAAEAIDRVLQGETVCVEISLIAKDGREIPTEYSASALMDAGDIVQYIIAIGRDISERRIAEKRLLESEERFRRLSEAAFEAVVITENGRIIDINRLFAEMIGSDRESLIGMAVLDFVAPESKERVIQHVRSGYDKPYEHFARRQDGTIFPVEVHGVAMPYEGREVRVTAIRDVSDRVTVEARLRQSEKMEAVGQLAGGIAHDFNNQLAGILGYAELIREEVANDPMLARYADNILLGVNRAADLTGQLLAFSRKGKYQSAPVDLHRIIFEVANILGHSIDKRIVIEHRLKAHPPIVLGDPTQLQNVVLNLALNARDAMPGGGTLLFTTDRIELDEAACRQRQLEILPGTYVSVCVSDSGQGMSDETQKHIFEPFFTTKEVGKGTGMGLAAVYGTVKNHRGTISLKSALGKGSAFTLFLPAMEQDAAATEVAPRFESAATGSARILLVDDEEMLSAVAQEMLERLGYTVTTCQNGADAAALYKRSWETIDVVILDMVMPVMDGRDTFLALKAINPDVRVLLASGYSLDSRAQEMLAMGVKGFIQKPFKRRDLSKKLGEIAVSEK